MKVHELKTWPKYFKAIWNGDKTFEVRKNDRNYEVGDVLIFHEWDPETEEYTGWKIPCRVTYILNDPMFVKDGFVVMGIEKGERSFR